MIQIGKKKETVSDEPLEFLVACHGRIMDRLDILQRVADNIELDPPSALSALRNTIRFFDISGRLHTEDEEVSLFPRLRPRLNAEQIAYLDGLESQHREKERVYEDLKAVSQELEQGITPEVASRFRTLAARLAELYSPHICSENDVLMNIGREALTADELAAIREEMRARRDQAERYP